MGPMSPSSLAIAKTVGDFAVLSLRLPQLSSYPVEATHYLYLRPNSPKVPTEDTPREIFMANIPFDATDSHIRSFFARQLGGARVENVILEGTRIRKGITAPAALGKSKKRKRGKDEEAVVEVGQLPEVWDCEVRKRNSTAVVTFVDKSSAELALKEARRAARSGLKIVWDYGVDDRAPILGSARYLLHHKLRYPDHFSLQQSVDTFMEAFSLRQAAKAKELARIRAVPDADGFITVTGGARARPDREEEIPQSAGKKLKKKVGEDFYRFQNRERRKEAQQDLIRGLEEDAKKLEEMRKRRGKLRPE